MSARSGPIKKAANGSYFFVVDVGRDPATGKRRQAMRRGFRTIAEARAAYDELRQMRTQNAYVRPARLTVAEYLETWLAGRKHELQPSTWHSYERNLRLHVTPHIGAAKLDQVDGPMLKTLYAQLREAGRADGRGAGLSDRTVRYIGTIVERAFADAVDDGLLARSPAERSRARRRRAPAQRAEMKTWDAKTLSVFLRLEQDGRYGPPFTFLATTGCRRGECLGLRWEDVDLDARRASIRQTVTRVGREVIIASRTKTGDARAIDLDVDTVAMLRTWRARQAEERLAAGPNWQDHGLVFTLPDGRPYHPERFSREFDRRVERHGIPRIRLHDLRHTWATLALQAGVPAKIVAERLGHASTRVTLDIYSHVTPTMGRDAAATVAGMIFRS